MTPKTTRLTGDPLTGRFIALDKKLPCGCVIKLVRTIDSFTDVLSPQYVDDYELDLTFCLMHEAAENLRGNLLGVKADMEAVSCVLNDIKN